MEPATRAVESEPDVREREPAPPLAGAAAHPWDGFLTGPENELAMAAAQAMARGEHAGDLAAGRAWALGRGQVAAAGGPGGRADAPRAGLGRGAPGRRDLRRVVRRGIRRRPQGRRLVGAARPAARGRPLDPRGPRGPGAGAVVARRAGAHARRARGRRRRGGRLGADGAFDLAAAGVAGPADQPAAGRPDRADRPARPGRAPPICPPPRRDRTARASRPRPSSGSPRPPTATAPSTAGSPGSRSKAGSGRSADGARARALDAATVDADPRRGGAPGRSRPSRSSRSRERWRRGSASGSAWSAGPAGGRRSSRRGTWPCTWPASATGSSFAAIGAYFGDRDPATVRHACRAAIGRLAADPALAAVAAAIAGDRTRNDGV